MERRVLKEIRNHLEDETSGLVAQGLDEAAAQRLVLERFGSPEEAVGFVIDSNRGLALIHWLMERCMTVAAVLMVPAATLLGFSFLTFNFPCQTDNPMRRACGVSFLQHLSPILYSPENAGLLSLRLTLTVVAPLLGAALIAMTILRIDLRRGERAVVMTVSDEWSRRRAGLMMLSLALCAMVIAYEVAP